MITGLAVVPYKTNVFGELRSGRRQPWISLSALTTRGLSEKNDLSMLNAIIAFL